MKYTLISIKFLLHKIFYCIIGSVNLYCLVFVSQLLSPLKPIFSGKIYFVYIVRTILIHLHILGTVMKSMMLINARQKKILTMITYICSNYAIIIAIVKVNTSNGASNTNSVARSVPN